MRILVIFDLPTITYANQKEYRKFHNFLIKSGYIMMQYSIYCKLALNGSIVDSEKGKLEKNKPTKGLVQVLVITEKQFSQMTYLVGKKETKVIDSDKRIIIL